MSPVLALGSLLSRITHRWLYGSDESWCCHAWRARRDSLGWRAFRHIADLFFFWAFLDLWHCERSALFYGRETSSSQSA